MKVLVIRNDKTLNISDVVVSAFEFTKKRTNLNYDIEYLDTTLDLQFKFFVSGADGVKYYGTDGTKEKLRKLIPEGKYKFVIFTYRKDDYLMPDGMITCWTTWKGLYQDTQYIELITSKMKDEVGTITRDLMHELGHAHCCMAYNVGAPNSIDEMDRTIVNGVMIPYYNNNNPDAVDGNFSHTYNNLKPYLPLLDKQTTPMYKYFKPNEIVGLKPELVLKLDQARELAGTPFNITSGFRTPEHNASIGGASKSAHILGLGVDIACTDNIKRFKILSALLQVGFKRIGIYTSHIHADCANTVDYPQNIVWISDKE